MFRKRNLKRMSSLALCLVMFTCLFAGLSAPALAADPLVFPAIYPASAIKPMDWDDPQLDALVWGVINALTPEELYDLQGGSSTNRGRNTGVWEDSYTWGTGYVHMVGALGVPVMRFWDGPQGVVTVGHFDTTLPPSEPAAAATWDRAAMYKYGTSYGRDNKASSANIQLGTQVDVMRSTHFSRSRDTLSEDTYLGSELAAQFVKGLEDQNVSATLKHVAGYNFSTGTNRDVRVDEQTFHENWMASPRKAIVEGGASSVMTCYNRINLPFYDTWAANENPKFYSGQGNAFFPQTGLPGPATPPTIPQSEKDYPVGYQGAWDTYLLKTTLRDMYGFQGLTMTDWGGNTAFSGFSGTTLETGTISRNTRAKFEEAIALGYGTLDDVKKNAYYNLKTIGKLGYLGLVKLDSNGVAIRGTIEGDNNTIELRHPLGQERSDILTANEALNLEVETKGAVLLKNDGNALPLKDAADKKVAVIGLSGQYALTSHYSEASAGWAPAKYSPLEKIDELMPLSDVNGYIGVNDIVGEPIPANLLWSDIQRPTQPDFSGDYDGVTAGVKLSVANYPADTDAPVTKILPDLKVLTGTNDYKNNAGGNGIPLGKSGSVATYLKAPADGIYGFKLLSIGGVNNGNIRISLLGDDMALENSTNITLVTTTFGRGTGTPAGSGYGTTSDVATREGLNIPNNTTGIANVTLVKDRWYKIEIDVRPVISAKDAQFQLNWFVPGRIDASRAAAVAAAGVAGTDVLFFAHQRGNGGSAAADTTNTLAADQVALLEDVSAAAKAAGNKVIFVGNISLALSMPWLDKVDAVLWMWLGGDTVGTATAQLLTGVVNPSGKTTLTFPKDSKQSQFGDTYEQNGNVASPGTYSVYFEGIYGGYKWYDWQNEAGVLFPFGYGLSYTTFNYSNLNVVPTPGAKYGYTVSVDVENTGTVAGGEAVQVYLSAPKDYVLPTLDKTKIMEEVQIAKKALVQFDKVYLAAGEKKTVTMDVGWEQLMFWDIKAPLTTQPDGTKGKWQPVVGERTFMVGGSSSNLPLSAKVTVEKVVSEGELVAGITAPEVLDTVASTALSYGVTVNNVPGTNAFEITAKFDNTRLNYVDSTLSIPALYNPSFLSQPTFDAATGVYKASIVLLKQGTLWTIEDPTKILTVNFEAKSGLANKAQIKGDLTTVMVPEVKQSEVVAAYATLSPSSATTTVSNQWRFDVNVAGGDGHIDLLDLSWIINRYYLVIAGDASWADAKVFDCNGDSIINLADILIISSYFTR